MEIKGQTAVVTGAAAGAGRAIARALCAAGAEVVAADINERRGSQTVAEAGGTMSFQRADVTVPDDVRRRIASSQPQILVNNAGGGGHIPPYFPDASPKKWEATLDLNLRAPSSPRRSRWSTCGAWAAERS